MRAAVPKYVGTEFSKAPPGHRFRLYFPVWNDKWGIENQKKDHALAKVLDMSPCRNLVGSLNDRAEKLGADGFQLTGIATAPFVTGMGMEHPLENGFAFLDPYGVPYLPGSSVKGVPRRAAEELALFEADNGGWSLPAVWWLFGFEASSGFFAKGKNDDPEPIREERKRWKEAYARLVKQAASGSAGLSPKEAPGLLTQFRKLVDPKEKIAKDDAGFLRALQDEPSVRSSIHTRGSLAFWDVIPLPGTGDAANLRVDIMNPHYSHYYQGKEPPHDAGTPKPLFFLTVPPGWRFTFTVQLLPVVGLPAWFTGAVDGRPRWQHLIEAAFQHAFDWLGFGAKTSLGYGAMTSGENWAPPRVEEVQLASPPPGFPRARNHGPRGERVPGGPKKPARGPARAPDSDPLMARITAVRPNDRAGIQALADEIAAIEDERRRRRLALELRGNVGKTPFGRAILNNHPVLKKYW